jgi:hypothetical protein
VKRTERKEAKISQGVSWKALMAKISRLQRLRIFDRGSQFAIKYDEMLQPGRVNIIDLSDVENLDVRNLAIAEMPRGNSRFTKRPPRTRPRMPRSIR